MPTTTPNRCRRDSPDGTSQGSDPRHGRSSRAAVRNRPPRRGNFCPLRTWQGSDPRHVPRGDVRVSAPELVTVTVDDVEVQVPKGTGLVETALAAGIEIPVFCYEPRLGPPVGACRMCLVEVEGMPKLQAGCTLTAQDGMVVKTARTSKQAAEGQNAR